MPPLPRRAMVPDRNCRQLDCPVPIAHRGRGSAEVDLKATFSYKKNATPYPNDHPVPGRIWSVLGSGTMAFGSASTTHHSLCPCGHSLFIRNSVQNAVIMRVSIFVVAGNYCHVGYIGFHFTTLFSSSPTRVHMPSPMTDNHKMTANTRSTWRRALD